MALPCWIDQYAPLAGIEPHAREILDKLSPLAVAGGKTLFAPGEAPPGFVLVLDGQVRVSLTALNGRTLVLYRVGPGETCVQTTLCLMAHANYSAEGFAETPLRLVIVPAPAFHGLLRNSPCFAEFVFGRFGARLTEMTRLIEAIAFVRVDARLAAALLERAGRVQTLAITHHELADEIGAAREVVSRQLSAFQREGLVSLSRGAITLTDRRGLESLRSVT